MNTEELINKIVTESGILSTLVWGSNDRYVITKEMLIEFCNELLKEQNRGKNYETFD